MVYDDIGQVSIFTLCPSSELVRSTNPKLSSQSRRTHWTIQTRFTDFRSLLYYPATPILSSYLGPNTPAKSMIHYNIIKADRAFKSPFVVLQLPWQKPCYMVLPVFIQLTTDGTTAFPLILQSCCFFCQAESWPLAVFFSKNCCVGENSASEKEQELGRSLRTKL